MVLFLRHTRLHQEWRRCKNRLGKMALTDFLDSRGVWKFLDLCGGNFCVDRERAEGAGLIYYVSRRDLGAWRGDSLVWIAGIRERKDTRGTQKG